MSVSKNEKNGTWEVRTYYKNFDGKLKQTTKRGFKKKLEALKWEQDFKNQKKFNMNLKV